MSKLGAAAFALWLLGLALSGCSLAGPREIGFSPAAAPVKAKPGVTSEAIARKMETDASACRSIARQRGISSVLAIVKSVNRSNTDNSYIACMKKKGYKVEGQPEMPTEDESPDADQEPPAPE